MVSNMFSRRRHTLPPPAICKPPPPRPPYPPPPPPCTCTVTATYNTTTKILTGGGYAWLPELPDNDPVVAWIHSTPQLDWLNPYGFLNHHPQTFGNHVVPPGTEFVAITVGYEFTSGRRCSAHYVCETPGA